MTNNNEETKEVFLSTNTPEENSILLSLLSGVGAEGKSDEEKAQLDTLLHAPATNHDVLALSERVATMHLGTVGQVLTETLSRMEIMSRVLVKLGATSEVINEVTKEMQEEAEAHQKAQEEETKPKPKKGKGKPNLKVVSNETDVDLKLR